MKHLTLICTLKRLAGKSDLRQIENALILLS